MASPTDRPGSPPDHHVVVMGWHDLLFAHWPVTPSVVEAALPPGLEAATYDGEAWLGVVAFVMEDIRPPGLARGLSFGECNLRTYVRGPGGDRGIYFFSLDAADALAVWIARLVFRLPYYRASMEIERQRGEPTEIEFTSHRIHRNAPPAHFDATYRPHSAAFEADPGTLEAFLAENYCFFTAGTGDVTPGVGELKKSGRLYRADVAHEPWPLQTASADIRTNTLFEVNGFEPPDGEPLLHYSPGVEVRATRLSRVA